MYRIGVVFSFLFLFGACSQQSKDSGLSFDTATVAGFSNEDESSQVPGHTKQAILLVNVDTKTACSASLTGDRNIMLVAAHCVYKRRNESFVAAFTTSMNEKPELLLKVKDIRVHKDYRPNELNADIAIIELSGKAPADYEVLTLPASAPTDLNFEVHGFGISTSSESESENKNPRSGSLRTLQIKANYILSFQSSMEFDQPQEQSVCYGDSGGPLTQKLNGKNVIFGIVSGSKSVTQFQDEQSDANTDSDGNHIADCKSTVNFTSIIYFKDWIQTQVRTIQAMNNFNQQFKPEPKSASLLAFEK